MAKFQITTPDGAVYEVEGENEQGAMQALQQHIGGAPNMSASQIPDAIANLEYGQPPEGMVYNPKTGQMEDLRSEINPNIPTGGANAAALGVGQGTGFNLLDEAAAGLNTFTGGDYDYDVARMREAERRAAEENPWAYYGGMIGGALTNAAALSRLGLSPTTNAINRGAGLGRVAATSAGEGAALGALYGAGGGEGATGRAMGAGVGALAGGAVGGAVPPLVSGVTRAGRALTAPILARLFPEGFAQRALGEGVRRSGMTVDDIAQALERSQADEQGAFTVADAMGNSGQRMLSTVARTPNDQRQAVVEALTSRQAGQGDRLVNYLAEGFGAPDTAAQRASSLTAARTAAANANYGAAREAAGAVDPTAAIRAADDFLTPGATGVVSRGNNIADDTVEAAVRRARSYLTDGDSVLTDFNAGLRAKQEIDAMIEGARPTVQRVLIPIRNALDDALSEASDAYAAARDTFRQQSRAIDAVEVGRAAKSGRMRADDTVPRFQAMTPEEQSAFRAGYVDPYIASIESSSVSPTTNKARALMTPKTGAEFPAFAVPGRAEQLGTRIAREQRMFETANTALGGSKSADNIADAADMARFDPSIMAKLFRGDIIGSLADAGRRAIGESSGMSPGVVERVAQVLMETNPEAARRLLQGGMQNLSRSDQIRANIIANLVTSGAAGTGRLSAP